MSWQGKIQKDDEADRFKIPRHTRSRSKQKKNKVTKLQHFRLVGMLGSSLAKAILPISAASIYVAVVNYQWEQDLKENYRVWFQAQNEYNRAIDQMCKAKKRDSCVYAKDHHEYFYCIQSPQQVLHDVKSVRVNYFKELKSLMPPKESKDNSVSNQQKEELSEFDYITLANPETSVKEREKLYRTYFGLEQSYHTFSIAIASSLEAAARDRMLGTLEKQPLTYFSTDEKYHNWNTRYLFWFGTVSGTLALSYLFSRRGKGGGGHSTILRNNISAP